MRSAGAFAATAGAILVQDVILGPLSETASRVASDVGPIAVVVLFLLPGAAGALAGRLVHGGSGFGLILAGCLVGSLAAETLGLFWNFGEAGLYLLAVGWWPALVGFGLVRALARWRPFLLSLH